MAISFTNSSINFSKAFAATGQAETKAAFEVQFQAIQKTVIKRANKEIAKATDDGTPQKLQHLQEQDKKLNKQIDQAQAYLQGLQTNKSRFGEIASTASTATNAVSSNTSLTTAEATALNTAKQDVINKIQKLLVLHYPGYSDSQVALRLKDNLTTLENLTAVAGTVDSSGSTTQTNDNRALIDELNTVSSQALTFADTTGYAIDQVNQFLIDTKSQSLTVEANATELSKVQLQKNQQKAADIKLKYANLLKAISLSFDANSSLASMLNTGSQPAPAKGSILNLFS